MDDALADKAKLAPARPLSGWGFSFPATGITLAAGMWGRPGLPATGPWRASEPGALGLPLRPLLPPRSLKPLLTGFR